ncbi:MAG: bacterioferritin [Deltaproteobacteria bacterium]|nr:bacterioferritin [Deltaproteobacteria bacterium]
MKGNQKVLELLNNVLTAELTAISQYFVHARLCKNWGYERLWKTIREQSIGEMKHADEIIERVIFLEGIPNVQRLRPITIGQSVPEQLKLDRDLEAAAIPMLNDGVETCRTAGDNGSRILVEEILRSEEEHIDWLDAQLALLKQVGESAYLAEQIHKE